VVLQHAADRHYRGHVRQPLSNALAGFAVSGLAVLQGRIARRVLSAVCTLGSCDSARADCFWDDLLCPAREAVHG
jgi:hypothetical protein